MRDMPTIRRANACATLTMLIVMVVVSMSHVQAESNVIDQFRELRYCGTPDRNKDGTIKRSHKVTEEFERLYPLPAGHNRKEWQIDHVIPRERGGCDAVFNLQWLPKTIKTCADDDCKDRWERSGIYPKKY